ncbi:MAG: PKD domain-containing protein [Thermoplasmata archaeon]|nr:MAG: PKD domain-containing protein [Thermoplasmata archaeon]
MLKFKCTNAGEAKIMLKNVTLSNINASRIEAYIENATITVFDNFAPVANFSYLPSNAAANETVTFNASMSYDSDGSIVNYTWDFGDGSTGYGCIVNHSYASNGAYNVTLLVKDDDGAIASIKKIVIIWVKWDINMDGRINILDLILIGQHWNEHGKRGWIRADVNDDGVINVLDMILVATHWTG